MKNLIAYQIAEEKIDAAVKSKNKFLDLSVAWDAPDYEWLEELPEALGKLIWLEHLNIEGNQYLTTLPSWIGKLSNLRVLNASWCAIKLLPIELNLLGNLEQANLSHNRLSSLPNKLNGLKKITEVDLSSNKFEIFPTQLKEPAHLTKIDLTSNFLSNIPEEAGYFPSINSMRLNSNKLKALPNSFRTLADLSFLDISRNLFLTLPEWIGELINLKVLCVSDNKIKNVPESMANLTQLKSLWLDNNKLSVVPQWIGNFSDITFLNLENNKIIDLPNSLGQLRQLKEIKLQNNPLDLEIEKVYKQSIVSLLFYLNERAEKTKSLEYGKRRLKIFFIYASEDRPSIYQLHQKLSKETWIDLWMDIKKLLPGQNWQLEIRNAVSTADCVIVFLSNISLNKEGFVQKELRLAVDMALEKTEGSVFLIPIRLDDCKVPPSLDTYHWEDYYGDQTSQTYEKIIIALRSRFDEILKRENLDNNPK